MMVVTKADSRPPKPRSKVPKAVQARRVHMLSEKMQKAVSVDIFRGITRFKDRIPKKQIQSAWESGQYDQLDKFIPWDKLHEDLGPAQERIDTGLFKGSGLAFHQLPANVKPKLRWDMNNPRIRNYVDKRVGNLIADITHETRVRVHSLISRSMNEALTPRRVADEVVKFIGLHERYANALTRYQTRLAQAGTKPELMSRMVDKYEQQLLKSRSMNIGRTEVHRALNHGQREVWREAANQGYIDKETSKRIWVVDGAPCEICEPMDGEEADLDGSYKDGLEPGEVHTNCFCTEVLDIGG